MLPLVMDCYLACRAHRGGVSREAETPLTGAAPPGTSRAGLTEGGTMNITARTRRWRAAAIARCSAILLPGMALAAPAAPAHPALHATAPGCETPGLVIWLDTERQGDRRQRLLQPPVHQPVRAHLHAERFPVHHRGQPDRRPARPPGRVRSHDNPALRDGEKRSDRRGGAPDLGSRQPPPVEVQAGHCRQGGQSSPPNQTRAKVVPFPFAACSASGAVFLRVAAGHEVAAPGVRGGPGQARRPPCTLGAVLPIAARRVRT